MSDHREPVATVNVPSPTSANVPSVPVQDKESFDKENVTLMSVKPVVLCAEKSVIENQKEANSLNLQSTPKDQVSIGNQPTNAICHGLTSVVPILSQAPCGTSPLILPSTVSLAHSVVSLLPKVISPSLSASCTTPSCTATVPSSSLKGHENAATSGTPIHILKPSTATNLPSTSRGTTSRPKIPIAETIPDTIPDFLPGKIDAKRFPARHFELSSLEIGAWKYETKSNGFFTPTTSRLKVIFSQRKFVYEFELRTASFLGILPLFQKEKIMTCIEVPFSSITGLNIAKDGWVVIEVQSAPSMYLGKQVLFSPATGCARPTKYDTSNSVDLTGGHLLTTPYHKIKLSSNNLRYRLESFDPRFDALLRTPITMDPDKKLDQSQNPLAKQKKVTDFSGQPAAKRPRRPSCSSITGEIVCMCSSGCNTQRCSCFKMNGKCGSECKCMACRNPLNILADNGINIDHAKEDQCLMQNIAKMKDLGKFIKENIERTPCCDAEISMKDACVGVVLCPECSAEYRFSWCTFSLHDDEDRPRNHCSICKKCGDYRDDHCQKCNKCYFAGRSGTLKCPCQDRPSFIDSLGAFIGALRDPVSDYSDDDYY